MIDIPIFKVEGKTIPEAWENSVIKTWREGLEIPTEYDKEGDPPSRDCTMIIVIENPFLEPRIHRAFPASLEDLEVYRQEVVDGIHDHYVEKSWSYSYHDRIFNYPPGINQIDFIVEKLEKAWYSRRAQAITWIPENDPQDDEPPCFQRGWCRLTKNKDNQFILNFNTHWRSRDAFKAAFMNIWAFTDLQRVIAEKLREVIGEEVLIGRYVDISDSYHIYGSYYKEMEKFLDSINNKSFEERTWVTDAVESFFEKAREEIEQGAVK